MTDEEALALKEGDRVRFELDPRRNPHWEDGEVIRVHAYDNGTRCRIVVRRLKLNSKNRPFQHYWRKPGSVMILAKVDCVTANVFADFLEEHGEHRAAQMLRQAFPFCDGKAKSPPPGT